LQSLALAGLSFGPGGSIGSISASVEALTRALADPQAVLAVHDADRLDNASAAVLGTVAVRQGVGVVVTMRPPFSSRGLVRSLLAGRDATVMWAPIPSFEDVHRSIHDELGGDVETDVAGRVYALSGGLPGIARMIVVEARRAGHLVSRDGRWTARRELWTPALAVAVERLLDGLSEEAVAGLWLLAALGPADLGTVRRLLPWPVVVALDDAGLVRFEEVDGQPHVMLYPPLLTEHLQHTGRGARGLGAVENIRRALGPDDDHPGLPAVRTLLPGSSVRWSATPESVTILGRMLREQSAARLLARRGAWERDPTSLTAVAYLDALLVDGAPGDLVTEVLEVATSEEHIRTAPDAAIPVRSWAAVYRALVHHDPQGALDLLAGGPQPPQSAALLDAVRQHIHLLSGQPASLPDPPRRARPGGEQSVLGGDLESQSVRTLRLVRGEILLARGSIVDAGSEFALLGPSHAASRHDDESLLPLAQLCAGELVAAADHATRLHEEARGNLDPTQIEPTGYVVGLALYLQGELDALRDHLTGIFATASPAALRPGSRAGLLCLGAALSLLEHNLPSARSMIAQAEGLRLVGSSMPMIRPAPAGAALAVASGRAPRESTRAAWEGVAWLLDRDYVLAATFDAAWLVDLHVDEQKARTLAGTLRTAQGTALPALGRYLEAAAHRSVSAVLDAAEDLRNHGLVLHGTRAHTMAIGLLHAEGDAGRAAQESARLRALLASGRPGADLLAPVLTPTARLTSRELEVARLVSAGLSNKDAARRLVVSERTIDNHLYRIFRKVGVTNRAELAALL